MRISIKIDTIEAKALFKKWGGEIRPKVIQAVNESLNISAKEIQPRLQAHIANSLNIKSKGFVRSYKVKVINKDATRLPALYLGSRVPWSGIHDEGGTISGHLLIPLYGRVPRKTFKKIISDLISSGNAFFVKDHKGSVILMARNSKSIAGFRKRYKKAEGINRIKKDEAIPIATLVSSVKIPKRTDILSVVQDNMTNIISNIQNNLEEIL